MAQVFSNNPAALQAQEQSTLSLESMHFAATENSRIYFFAKYADSHTV